MSKRLHVGNLSYQTTKDDLEKLFAPFGAVMDATVITDRDTGRSRGFGFVEMADMDAEKAMAQLDGQEMNGRCVTVTEARAVSRGGR
ncbi:MULTISPECIES: RNA recognition motif domain-containing protein [Streptomyces]|uniref:RNA-binding protein n=2 Tax=Streptomyces TaxID=1883 RepID=D9WT02_9ACTN|nr:MULTISPECIES: RNA-binding protein [Streptomyces]EFL24277.1 RNA-binding protein [Streptomyces himastatinicus ATCC 53653]RNG24560.1 RNA-binding protein [Streptomyces botrytidirepellens]